MNKAQLVNVVQKEMGKDVSKAAAERMLDAVLRSIVEACMVVGRVELVGFGTFRVSQLALARAATRRRGHRFKSRLSKTVRFSAG